jgi:hypothetical protein
MFCMIGGRMLVISQRRDFSGGDRTTTPGGAGLREQADGLLNILPASADRLNAGIVADLYDDASILLPTWISHRFPAIWDFLNWSTC